MTTYDIYNPPIADNMIDTIRELSDKEVWGFYFYVIDHPNVTYKQMSDDLNIPIDELVRIHKKCHCCSQRARLIDIGNYEVTQLHVYGFMEQMIIAILDSFYDPFDEIISWFEKTSIRMLPYYNDDVGEM